MATHVRTRKITTGELYSSACGINYLDSLRGERKLDFLDVEERRVAPELSEKFAVLGHEFGVAS
jgi:hypothetical protein